jgi:hypothetical protein
VNLQTSLWVYFTSEHSAAMMLIIIIIKSFCRDDADRGTDSGDRVRTNRCLSNWHVSHSTAAGSGTAQCAQCAAGGSGDVAALGQQAAACGETAPTATRSAASSTANDVAGDYISCWMQQQVVQHSSR